MAFCDLALAVVQIVLLGHLLLPLRALLDLRQAMAVVQRVVQLVLLSLAHGLLLPHVAQLLTGSSWQLLAERAPQLLPSHGGHRSMRRRPSSEVLSVKLTIADPLFLFGACVQCDGLSGVFISHDTPYTISKVY